MILLEKITADKQKILLWSVYALILLGVLYRIFYIVNHNPIDHIWSDPERHWVQGIDAKRNDPMTMIDPVMYQLYIATLSKLTFMNSGLVAFFTIFLCLLTPLFWYRFFRELQPSRQVALLGLLVLVWLPSWLSIYSYFMQETLMLPLLGLALWMSWRCKRKKTINSFALVILLWCLAGLTRGICIPLAAVVTIWLWVSQTDKPLKAIYGVVILAMVLVPLAIRSIEQIGILAPHGVGQMNIIYAKSGKKEINITFRRQGSVWRFGFMSPALLVAPFEPLSDWKTERTGKVFVDIDIDKGSKDWKTHLDLNQLTFKKYFRITRENLIFLFFAESWPDSNRGYLLGNLNYQMRWIWAPLGIIVLTLTAVFWRSQKQHFLLPAMLLVWLIVQGLLPLAVNEGRYRKPFEGLLLAQIVLLAGTYQQWRKSSERMKAASDNHKNALEHKSVVKLAGDEQVVDSSMLTDSAKVSDLLEESPGGNA